MKLLIEAGGPLGCQPRLFHRGKSAVDAWGRPATFDRRPAEGRAYNSEPLEWRTATWDAPTDARPAAELLYGDVYDAIRHGRPHPVTPQSVRRLISVMEQCRASVARATSP